MRELSRTAPADLLHVHELFRPPHLVLGAIARRTPVLVSTHGATHPQNLARYPGRKRLWASAIDRPMLRRAAGLVALTLQEADHLRAFCPAGPEVHVLPNVADADLLDGPAWSPVGERAPVISLGRWDVWHKGLDRLAELARQLPDRTFRVHGSECGNEPERLAQLRATAPLNLELRPSLSPEARASCLRTAGGFVLLSRWEGLSMALLEAMAVGVPCFVSAEVRETVDGGDHLIVVPDDPVTAAMQVRRHLEDPTQLAERGAAGRAWARAHASEAAVRTAALQLLDAVVPHAAGPHLSVVR